MSVFHCWNIRQRLCHHLQCLLQSFKDSNNLFCSKPGHQWLFSLLYNLSSLDHKIRTKRFGKKLFCFVEHISPISVLLSILTLLPITVDKFVFIKWPLRYYVIVTWRRTYFALFMIWVFGIILIPIIMLFTTTEPCDLNMFLRVSIFLVYICIPFFIIFVLNYKICKIAREQKLKIAVNTVQSPNSSSINSVFSSWRISRELTLLYITVYCDSICRGILVPWFLYPRWDTIFVRRSCWSKLDYKSIYLRYSTEGI